MDEHFSFHLGKYYKTLSIVSLSIPLISAFSLGIYRSTRSFNEIENPYKDRIYSMSVIAPTFLGLAGVFAFIYLFISDKLKPNGAVSVFSMIFTFLFLLLSLISYLTVAMYDTFLNDDKTDFGSSFGGLVSILVYISILVTIILKYLVNRFHPLDSSIGRIEENIKNL